MKVVHLVCKLFFSENVQDEDYDMLEAQYTVEFKKRKSDLCHDINLVCSKVVDVITSKNPALNEARKLATKIHHSTTAIQTLISKAGKSIPSPGTTRWLSNYIFLDGLSNAIQYVNEVASQHLWSNINVEQLAELKCIKNLLKPFYELLLLLQKKSTSFTQIYVQTHVLFIKLDEVEV